MSFETKNPAAELRCKAKEMFPYDDNLARSTYHWNAADEIDRLTAENEKLRKAVKRIDYYYDLNDCDEMKPIDAIEIDVKCMREIHLIALEQKVREET